MSRALIAVRIAGESGFSLDGKYIAGLPRVSIRYLLKFHCGGRLHDGEASPRKSGMALGPVTFEILNMGNDTPKLRAQNRFTWEFHHPVATLRMGRDDDPMAVTDGDGRIRGLNGAWCIDASIIPRVPSANTHLAVIALSEKLGAQFLEGTGHGAAAVEPV